MFVESITQDREEAELWIQRLRIVEDPPAALVASIAFPSENDTITVVNVWDTPGAVADNYIERVAPLIEELGEPKTGKPHRHGPPVHVYSRR